MEEEFLEKVNPNSKAPWDDVLLKTDDYLPLLIEEKSDIFHSLTMKCVLLVKKYMPDLEPGFGFLSSKVRASTQHDWSKLVKSMSLIIGTKDEVLTLSADASQYLYWRVGTALGVFPYLQSHPGGTFIMGFGAASSSSTKQKVNSRS